MGANNEVNLLPETDVKAALAAGEAIEKHRAAAKRAPDYLHGLPYVILKDSAGAERIEYVDRQKECPAFRKGLVALQDAASFVAYFNKYATPASAIYATMRPCNFVAVLDEHPTAGPAQWRGRARRSPRSTLPSGWRGTATTARTSRSRRPRSSPTSSRTTRPTSWSRVRPR